MRKVAFKLATFHTTAAPAAEGTEAIAHRGRRHERGLDRAAERSGEARGTERAEAVHARNEGRRARPERAESQAQAPHGRRAKPDGEARGRGTEEARPERGQRADDGERGERSERGAARGRR